MRGQETSGGQLPGPLQQALDSNLELKEALRNSGMPLRFQAMVLGLATLRQVNPAHQDEYGPNGQTSF